MKRKVKKKTQLAKVMRKKKRKPLRLRLRSPRKQRAVRPKAPATAVSPTSPRAVIDVPIAQPSSSPSIRANTSAVPRYTGPWGPTQVERLLHRAGFGPRPGDIELWSGHTMEQTVHALTRPEGHATLQGREPTHRAQPLAPLDASGHDHIWWLDRMVRSNQPLVERMTLIWHDWFATNLDGNNRDLMQGQNHMLRKHALGSFETLIRNISKDPAMLVWLNGNQNTKHSPNENYARELMELFTLGANRGAYTEADVQEMARAFTGWRSSYNDQNGDYDFRFDPNRHDRGRKTIFGKSGYYTWEDGCTLVLEHPQHASFVVEKLWGYFIPTPPDASTRQSLELIYRTQGYAIRPVLEAILQHPALYEGPRMIKPAIVYIASMMRALGRSVDTVDWTWTSELCGQRLFQPPSVAGWEDDRWLDTSTFRARWNAVYIATLTTRIATDTPYNTTETAEEAVEAALAYWGTLSLTPETRQQLIQHARSCENFMTTTSKRLQYRIMRQNSLRFMVALSPDMHTS